MRYAQLRGLVRQLWLDHHGGVPLAPVSFKSWVQERTTAALMEYTDRNAAEVARHIAFDLRMDVIETVQFLDWLDFARQYGFAAKLDNEGVETT